MERRRRRDPETERRTRVAARREERQIRREEKEEEERIRNKMIADLEQQLEDNRREMNRIEADTQRILGILRNMEQPTRERSRSRSSTREMVTYGSLPRRSPETHERYRRYER